jgi:hypothetical protein
MNMDCADQSGSYGKLLAYSSLKPDTAMRTLVDTLLPHFGYSGEHIQDLYGQKSGVTLARTVLATTR